MSASDPLPVNRELTHRHQALFQVPGHDALALDGYALGGPEDSTGPRPAHGGEYLQAFFGVVAAEAGQPLFPVAGEKGGGLALLFFA